MVGSKLLTTQTQNCCCFRYLVTGSSFQDLSLQFYRGKSTISYIVHSTCAAIWSHLQPLYMPQPTEESWKQISKRYYELWNLPNCIGSLDGKHFRIQCSPNTGSTDYNYKGFFSIVLMALSDADGMFTAIDVGDYGRNSDGAVFRKSTIGKLLQDNKLKIPEATHLPGEANDNPFPFYFVADEAFPLQHNIMRPFPKRVLNDARRIFNFRLSRGRKSVECSFGMLTSKFRLFDRPMYTNRSNAVQTIKTACVLHNFIRRREGQPYVPQEFNKCSVVPALSDNSTFSENNNLNAANRLRNKLGEYFLKPTGAIPTQWRCVGLQDPAI